MMWLRTTAACVGLVLASVASAQEASSTVMPSGMDEAAIVVPAGTVIDLVTTSAVSSKKSVKGDLLYLKVTAPLVVDGIVAIPADVTVVGQLSQANPRGAFGKKGKLAVQLLYAELPSGAVRISGALEARGKSDADDAAATAAAFLLLPFVATGRSAEIPAGSQVSGRLDRDLRIDLR